MIFGKHINRYYLRFLPLILLGLAALITVDYLQLLIPELYQMVINGMIDGQVLQGGVMKAFDMQFLLYEICAPLLVRCKIFCRCYKENQILPHLINECKLDAKQRLKAQNMENFEFLCHLQEAIVLN